MLIIEVFLTYTLSIYLVSQMFHIHDIVVFFFISKREVGGGDVSIPEVGL